MGSYDRLVDRCSGGWVGRVEILIKANGDRVKTAPFTDLLTTKRAKAGSGGGKGRRGAGKEGKKQEAELAPESQVKSVEVLWYGWRGGTATGKPVCLLHRPMQSLEIRDVVASSTLLYQEHQPGAVKMKKDGRLYDHSMRTLQCHLPKVGKQST